SRPARRNNPVSSNRATASCSPSPGCGRHGRRASSRSLPARSSPVRQMRKCCPFTNECPSSCRQSPLPLGGTCPHQQKTLLHLLRPCPSESIALHPVDARVGNVRNDDAGLVAPLSGLFPA